MVKSKKVTETKPLWSLLTEARDEISLLKEEMGTWRENLEEKLSATRKYEEVDAAASELEQIFDDVETPVSDLLEGSPARPAVEPVTRLGTPRQWQSGSTIKFVPPGPDDSDKDEWKEVTPTYTSPGRPAVDAVAPLLTTEQREKLITVSYVKPYGHSEPRWYRAGYSKAYLEAAAPTLKEDTRYKVDKEYAELVDGIVNAASSLDSIMFPGMY